MRPEDATGSYRIEPKIKIQKQMQVKIKKVTPKKFTGDDGEMRDYFWYEAIRPSDSFLFQFGSVEGGHAVGAELDLEIVKYIQKNGKEGYKELVES